MNQKRLLSVLCIFTITYSFAIGPQGSKKGRMGKPPSEAIIACESKGTGESCTVNTSNGKKLKGTCKNTPDDKYFVCMPSGMNSNRGTQSR